jgi:hypothetical protein
MLKARSKLIFVIQYNYQTNTAIEVTKKNTLDAELLERCCDKGLNNTATSHPLHSILIAPFTTDKREEARNNLTLICVRPECKDK